MKLTAQDWSDLEPLLRRGMRGDLDRSGEQQLRFLVSKANIEAARMNVAELTHYGLFLLGLHELARLGAEDEGITA